MEHSKFSAVDAWLGIGHFSKYDRDDQKLDFGDGNFYKLVCGGFVSYYNMLSVKQRMNVIAKCILEY